MTGTSALSAQRGAVIVDGTDAVTVWGSPGLVTDHRSGPAAEPVATLTVTFSVAVRTADPHPGAEQVDAILAALLQRGFTLLTGYDPAALAAAPLLAGWSGRLFSRTALLTLQPPGETFYDGDLGTSPPPGWSDAVTRRGTLAVLACTGVNLHRTDRTAQIRAAQQHGRVVAAQVPIDTS